MSQKILDAYGITFDLTITVASLASDASLLAGRSCAAVDNTSNLYLDYGFQGFSTTGTSPTVSTTIEWWLWWSVDGTNYPDAITGSDANISASSLVNKQAAFRLIGVQIVTASSNVKYIMPPFNVKSWIGWTPPKFGIFVVHNTAVNLNATSGNHKYTGFPEYKTVG